MEKLFQLEDVNLPFNELALNDDDMLVIKGGKGFQKNSDSGIGCDCQCEGSGCDCQSEGNGCNSGTNCILPPDPTPGPTPECPEKPTDE